MPAKAPSVNLLSDEDSSHTPMGKAVLWITSYGRYILITTELIVLIAFVSRFSLDRKLTDLSEEILQKQEILEVNQPLEAEIRYTQERLKGIKTIISQQSLPLDALTELHAILPPATYLDTLSIQPTSLSTSVTALSTSGFVELLQNLSSAKVLKNVEVGTISKLPLSGIKFPITAALVQPGPPAVQ